MDCLQPVGPDDEELLFQVYAATRANELAWLDWSAEQIQAFLKMQFAAQRESFRMQFPDAVHHIIVHDGVRIGRMVVHRSDRIRLVDLALLPEYRSAGVGTRLLRDLQTEAKHASQSIQLAVERSNPARHLYERLGFRQTAESSLYLEMEWKPE